MITCLISGIGGDAGLGALKAARSSQVPLRVVGSCISRLSAGLYECDAYRIAPPSNSDEYEEFLIGTIRDESVDLFIPTVDSETLKISYLKQAIEKKTNCKVYTGSPKQVAICEDKLKTADFLKQRGMSYARSRAADADNVRLWLEEIGYPVICKPRVGKGSKGVRLIRSWEEALLIEELEDLMFQEYLDPKEGEYTSGFYTSRDGRVMANCTMRRLLQNGRTVAATKILDNELVSELLAIAGEMRLPYINIQSMKCGGKLIPFEFNARLSGTTSIISSVFNPVEMFIREYLLGEELEPITESKRFTVLRRSTDIFLDAIDDLF